MNYPSIIENDVVALIPMQPSHLEDLHQAGKHPEIWRWTIDSYCLTLQSTQQWIKTCLTNVQKNIQYPYVIIDKATQTLVGSTSYLDIQPQHKAIEIGFTFLQPNAQRTHLNRHCKNLLLSNAFEKNGYNRVAFQTHSKNDKSRNAIAGLGATFEGVLRNNRVQTDGSLRSSAVFSIIRSEWPSVKAKFLQNIASYNK